MSKADYAFGDVVEWDIPGGVIRWFVISPDPADHHGGYIGLFVAIEGDRFVSAPDAHHGGGRPVAILTEPYEGVRRLNV
jgi:hypothetical protein